MEVMEFASVKHQGRTVKMLWELAPGWRPKTRPKNKFRLNSKKLMNPKLNIQEVTVLDDASSNEESEIGKMNIKRKEKAVAKASSSLPVKTTRSSQSVKELGQPEPKLSTMFFEIKNELLEKQQAKEAVSTNLLDEYAEIFKKVYIPWIPNDEQDTTTGRPFDSDRENMQKTIKQYK